MRYLINIWSSFWKYSQRSILALLAIFDHPKKPSPYQTILGQKWPSVKSSQKWLVLMVIGYFEPVQTVRTPTQDFDKMTLPIWYFTKIIRSGFTGRDLKRHLETLFSKQQTFILWSIKAQSEEVNSIWVNFKFILRIKRGNETFEWDDNERMYQCMPGQLGNTWEMKFSKIPELPEGWTWVGFEDPFIKRKMYLT